MKESEIIYLLCCLFKKLTGLVMRLWPGDNLINSNINHNIFKFLFFHLKSPNSVVINRREGSAAGGHGYTVV